MIINDKKTWHVNRYISIVVKFAVILKISLNIQELINEIQFIKSFNTLNDCRNDDHIFQQRPCRACIRRQ